MHGRMEPLDGDYFDNIFVHFTPASFKDSESGRNYSSQNPLEVLAEAERERKMKLLPTEDQFRVEI